MNRRPHIPLNERDAQTVRSLGALLALCLGFVLFVTAAVLVLETPAEPPVAAPTPEPPAAVFAAAPGT